MNLKKNIGDVMTQRWMLRSAVLAILAMASVAAFAGTNGTPQRRTEKDKASEQVQRTPRGVFDQQRNVVSNIDFQTTNYGIFGFDVRNGVGGTFWPRGRNNQYIFAGGAWFGARMRPPGSDSLRKRVLITYNPNSGLSWMVPGTIEDGDQVITTADAGINKYRTFFSTDFSTTDGTDFANPSFPRWPIWDTSPSDTVRFNNYYGLYVNDPTERFKTTYPKGPAFISEEDVFSVYKDTDLNYYEGGVTKRKADGYPLGFQIEQMVYSWGFGDYADFLFLKYMFIHPASYKDTLYDCWMAAVQDVDIALRTNPVGGAQNDRARFYDEEPGLNLAVQWTNVDRGEAGQGFGYLGFNFLESPAIDAEKFMRKDKRQFPVSEQLGMRTMRNWPITEDPIENEDRYNFISSQRLDGDLGPGDRRLMMATGPFHMRPGDSARIVVGIILGGTANGGDATGTTEDMAELIRKVRFAQFVYDNQFRAPKPPDLTVIKGAPRGSAAGKNSFMTIPEEGFLPLNNAIAIQWDSTAEISVDTLERGLDFMGYRIYRARRIDQDTFAVDFQENARKGPLAWKQIGQFAMASPFVKEGAAIGNTGVRMDQFQVVDVIKPNQRKFMVVRSVNLQQEPWGSYFSRLLRGRDSLYGLRINRSDSTIITTGFVSGTNNRVPNFDKLDSIRFTYFTTLIETLPPVRRLGANLQLDTIAAKVAKDSLVKLILARRVKMEPFQFNDTDTVFSADGSAKLVAVKRPWEETNEVRKEIVAKYMRETTNGRVFFDLGDDDRNGTVTYSANAEASEKLINNIDYTYAVRAYDEGDYLLPTPPKLNNRAVGLPNVVTATPLASRPGNAAAFTFTTDDANRKKLGGIYNVRLLVNDQQRFNQLFAGRTLELEFFRFWTGFNPVPNSTAPGDGLYGVVFILRDSSTREELNTWTSFLPPELCPSSNVPGLPGYFTENSAVYVDTNQVMYDTVYNTDGSIRRIDSTLFGLPDSREKVIRSGMFTSDAACFANKYAFGALGVAFDYAIEQWGGIYRADTAFVASGPAGYPVSKNNSVASVYNNSNELNPAPPYIQLPYPDFVPAQPWATSYNNGPGIYEVTFKEGGTESIRTNFEVAAGRDSLITFSDVPYLTYDIKNVYSFERQDPRADGTVGTATVGYDFNLTPQVLDYAKIPAAQVLQFPNPEAVLLGHFTGATFGWRNSRGSDFRPSTLARLAAQSNDGKPVGEQNRYYLSRRLSTGGGDTLDFTHVIALGGTQFVLDFAQLGRIRSNRTITDAAPTPSSPVTQWATEDVKPGDKIRLLTFGGAFGFPFDSAKAYIRVAQYDPYTAQSNAQSYSDEQLEQVQVVPNPYYVTHEGVTTPFQGQLYFTRLPRVCKISIFTSNGELVKVIDHNETNGVSPDRAGADVWNLLSKNNQRVASQMLVAKIETPEGASVIRKFTIIVGPARVVGDGQ